MLYDTCRSIENPAKAFLSLPGIRIEYKLLGTREYMIFAKGTKGFNLIDVVRTDIGPR